MQRCVFGLGDDSERPVPANTDAQACAWRDGEGCSEQPFFFLGTGLRHCLWKRRDLVAAGTRTPRTKTHVTQPSPRGVTMQRSLLRAQRRPSVNRIASVIAVALHSANSTDYLHRLIPWSPQKTSTDAGSAAGVSVP